ncbi:MAG: hypothetical protein IT393_10730 [Nitrospirae bacterium]|nr:hypothetical protein [Nitrospirota bacterium]
MTRNNLVSQSEYARRKGVSKQHISRLTQKGIISLDDGKIDPVQADKQLAAAKDPARDGLRKSDSKVKKGESSYWKARTEREQIRAKRERLEYEKAIGQLVDAEEVRLSAFNRGRILRDAIFNLPDRLAPLLAAESDVKKVNAILHKELRAALEEQSNVKP